MSDIRFTRLREKAATILKKRGSVVSETYQKMELEELMQEMEILHAELEAQNEELVSQQTTLLERNRDLDLLFNHASIGYVLLDEKYFIINANLQAFAVLGLSKSRLRHEHFYNYLAPGEVKRFLDWMMDYEKHPLPLRVPLRCRDGERHVQMDLHFHEDEGPAQKTFLSIQDCSELFRTVHERDRYLEMVDQHVMISRTDFDGVIQYVSDAFCQMTGYTKEELLGHKHNLLRDEETPESLYTEMWNRIISGECWQGELKNRTKDGEPYWVHTTVSPWYGDFGEVVGYAAIRQNITDKKRIEELSIHDPLTGLFNRGKLDELLEYEVAQAERYEKSLALILFDIDHFKAINDRFGHLKGDEVLKSLAGMVGKLVRKSDSVGRWGGEEFMILCPETAMEGASLVAEKIRASVEAELEITCSFGVAELQKGDSEEAVIHRADQAMYRAKESGRNRIECDEPTEIV